MAGKVRDLSDAEFKQEVLDSSTPTLVDFWATWCGPCKAIAPVIEELAETYDGKINFAKIDVDQNQGTPSQYGIRGVPTLILFKDGEILDQLVGARSKDELVSVLDKAI